MNAGERPRGRGRWEAESPHSGSGTLGAHSRPWRSRLIFRGFGAAGLLSVVWMGLIFLTERSAPPPQTAILPSQAAVLDPRYRSAIEKARAQVRAMMAERQIPGLCVAVAKEGKLIWSEGFGYADRERQVPASPRTRFRIASVSKLLTAAAMARLYEQGRLDLDAPIQQYVPGFPEKGYRITARQLASHRSGIRGYRDDMEAINTRPFRNVTESLQVFRDDPLEFAPDTRFLYSGYGYVLLSAAIEGAAGEPFLSCMRRQVFEPLEMSHTCPDRVGARAPDEACSYDIETPFSDGRHVRRSPYDDFSNKWAAGGFLSTAEDLVRFGSAHMVPMNTGFLKRATLDLLFTPRTRQAGIVGYGLGWMTIRDLHLRRLCFHTGAGSGGTSVLMLYPEQHVCVSVVANLGHAKFPVPRLMGILNPFLADPARWVLGALATGFLGAGIALVARRCGRR